MWRGLLNLELSVGTDLTKVGLVYPFSNRFPFFLPVKNRWTDHPLAPLLIPPRPRPNMPDYPLLDTTMTTTTANVTPATTNNVTTTTTTPTSSATPATTSSSAGNMKY